MHKVHNSNMCADIEYSDDEVQVDVDGYKTAELAFGKYRGRTFGNMMKTPRTRGYLKYLLKWDELKPVTRAHIQYALAAYENSKKKHAAKRTTSPSPSSTGDTKNESPKRKRPASEPSE